MLVMCEQKCHQHAPESSFSGICVTDKTGENAAVANQYMHRTSTKLLQFTLAQKFIEEECFLQDTFQYCWHGLEMIKC